MTVEHRHEGGPCGDPNCAAGRMTARDRRVWEAECLAQFGFWVDYVEDEFAGLPRPRSRMVNYHTHGFVESWGHPDFQIVFPLPVADVMATLHTFAERVKKGDKFTAGQICDEIIEEPYKVKLAAARECGRDVLRILVPDKANKFPGDAGVDPKFAIQAEV